MNLFTLRFDNITLDARCDLFCMAKKFDGASEKFILSFRHEISIIGVSVQMAFIILNNRS